VRLKQCNGEKERKNEPDQEKENA